MLSLEVIAVASGGETHASRWEKVTWLLIVWVCLGKKWPICGNMEKKKSNSAVMCPCISYRHFAEVQPDFDWPLVPKAPDPEFEVTCWFYLLVFIWWLCYVPAVWTRGRHNY